jgi:NHLM bacteriocin system ABC transporter ATP-binding protein
VIGNIHDMDALLGNGEDIPPQPDNPLRLLETSDIFVVTAGRVMIFAQRSRDGIAVGERVRAATLHFGDLLFGMRCDDAPAGLLIEVVTTSGTTLRRYALPSGVDSALACEFQRWLTAMLPHTAPPGDQEMTMLTSGKRISLASGEVATAKDLLWVRSAPDLAVEAGGLSLSTSAALVPVCPGIRLTAKQAADLEPCHTSSLCAAGQTQRVISCAVTLLLAAIDRQFDVVMETFIAQVGRRQAIEEAGQASVLESLRHAIDVRTEGKETFASGLPILDACRMVAKATGIELPLHVSIEDGSWMSPVEQICRAGCFRSREVALAGRWWKLQNGPVLAKTAQGNPVAVIPRGRRYDAHVFDGTGPARLERVDGSFAETLRDKGWTFYRPLPPRSLRLRDVLRFVVHGSLPDLARIVFLAVAVALISLVVPFAVGKLIDTIIPSTSRKGLLFMIVVLATAAFSSSMLSLASGFAALRFQTRASYDFLAALLDRVVSLPATFSRQFSAGDLCQRMMGVEQIRQTLTQSTVSTLLAGISSIGYLFFIFYYNSKLALVALGFAALAAVVTGILAVFQVHFQQRIQYCLGRLDALMLQLFTGIEKIRVAAAERRMFTNWGLQFAQLWSDEFKSGVTTNILTVFNGAYPLAAAMVLFWVYVHYTRNASGMIEASVATGDFMAVYAAFSALLVAAASVGAVIMPTMLIIPIYKRLKPVVETPPEGTERKTKAASLRGDLAVEGVTFGYDLNLPPVLQDLSMRASPGEFVAIVGPSGSGKSTLLKILLGLEAPQKGEVFYDGRSLTRLDIHSVRRQIGVVMQDTRIMPGFIRELLLGSANLTLDDAWAAARLAGIDEEIRAMPMGMFTYVGDTTISGGQRQRLLIARALVTRPRMLFFDEATSALDSVSQAVVRESIDNLGVTRIVIAHRLSTIMNADRIYVLDAGRIAQCGSYPELMSQDGFFKKLAARQLV